MWGARRHAGELGISRSAESKGFWWAFILRLSPFILGKVVPSYFLPGSEVLLPVERQGKHALRELL